MLILCPLKRALVISAGGSCPVKQCQTDFTGKSGTCRW